MEARLHELTYEYLCVTVYAVALSGIDRPSFWTRVIQEVRMSATCFPMRGLGLLMGACRKCLAPSAAYSGDLNLVVELLGHVGMCMTARSPEITFPEASEILQSLSLLPVHIANGDEHIAMFLSGCDVIQKTHGEFPPSYLACGFHALAALYLEMFADKHVTDQKDQKHWHAARTAARGALCTLATELRTKLLLCEPQHTGLMAEALHALTRLEDLELIRKLNMDTLLLVQQREMVRRAHDFNSASLVEVACLTASAVASTPAAALSCRGPLQAWFIPHILAFVNANCESSVEAKNDEQLRQRMAWLAEMVESTVRSGRPIPCAMPHHKDPKNMLDSAACRTFGWHERAPISMQTLDP